MADGDFSGVRSKGDDVKDPREIFSKISEDFPKDLLEEYVNINFKKKQAVYFPGKGGIPCFFLNDEVVKNYRKEISIFKRNGKHLSKSPDELERLFGEFIVELERKFGEFIEAVIEARGIYMLVPYNDLHFGDCPPSDDYFGPYSINLLSCFGENTGFPVFYRATVYINNEYDDMFESGVNDLQVSILNALSTEET
jgi:hypothetical protein